MLYYDKTDISKGIYLNKTSESKECNICHYWWFLGKGLKIQQDISNGCYDLLMMYMRLSDIAVLNIHSVDYRCISGISKSEATKLMQNVDLTEKSETL